MLESPPDNEDDARNSTGDSVVFLIDGDSADIEEKHVEGFW